MKKLRTEQDEEEVKDIYSPDYIEELEEDDEISVAEQGFMEGYLEA